MKRGLVLALVAVVLTSLGHAQSPPNRQQDHTVTKAMVDTWMTQLANWGRWGKDDQKGTINLLTPERRKRALAAARDGVSVSLSHTYIERREADATSPFGREMLPI